MTFKCLKFCSQSALREERCHYDSLKVTCISKCTGNIFTDNFHILIGAQNVFVHINRTQWDVYQIKAIFSILNHKTSKNTTVVSSAVVLLCTCIPLVQLKWNHQCHNMWHNFPPSHEQIENYCLYLQVYSHIQNRHSIVRTSNPYVHRMCLPNKY